MIKITDTTLCSLELGDAPCELLLFLYSLILRTGVDYIEMNPIVLEKLGENIDKSKTVLRLEDPMSIKDYSGFASYICRHSGFEMPQNGISEIQVNDIRELSHLNKCRGYKNVRITGLDDLILHDYANTFKKIREGFGGKVEFCPQNLYFGATALIVEWIMSGGEDIVVSFLGLNSNAPLEEVLMALRITKRYKPNLDLSVLSELKRVYEAVSGERVPPNKPIVGENIFHVESGIHVDGIIKNSTNFEPFEPRDVGGKRKVIVGKHSGKSTVVMKLKKYNISIDNQKISMLLEMIKSKSIEMGRSLSDEEFIKLAKEVEKEN
ncbi:MAG: isopropylmalate synthase [Clostridia bacterium]|nr:isopropylmalate synthase [Clostridia bacterium]